MLLTGVAATAPAYLWVLASHNRRQSMVLLSLRDRKLPYDHIHNLRDHCIAPRRDPPGCVAWTAAPGPAWMAINRTSHSDDF